MSLSFVIGLAAAAMVESFFLGGLLLYLSARCWKTPVSLGRAVGLCCALMATSTAGSVISLLVSLNRITIQRDVYYLGREMRDPRGYGSSGQPVELGETECFMLGDNSVRSLDSRMQRDVQTDDILGIARWIYWPKKRMHEFQ